MIISLAGTSAAKPVAAEFTKRLSGEIRLMPSPMNTSTIETLTTTIRLFTLALSRMPR